MLEIKQGDRLTITYPTSSHVKFVNTAGWKRRRIECLAMRDLLREPLTLDEFLRRPFVLRSRWLIAAIDRDLSKPRKFYLGCSHEFAAPSRLRLAIYEANDTKPTQWIGREFGCLTDDRKQLMQLAWRLQRKDVAPARLAVTAVDLRLFP